MNCRRSWNKTCHLAWVLMVPCKNFGLKIPSCYVNNGETFVWNLFIWPDLRLVGHHCTNKQRCQRWHGMRPSFQLLQECDVWKFQATPTLQLALEHWVLIRPAVSKHDTRLLWRFLTSCDLDLWPFHLKIVTLLTHALGNICVSFDFSTFLLFSS